MAWGTEGILVWFFSVLDPRLSDWNRFSDYIRKASEITSVKFCMHSYLHKPILQFYKTIGYINIWLLHSQQLMSEGDLWSFNKASSLLGTIHNSPQSTTIHGFQVLLFPGPEALGRQSCASQCHPQHNRENQRLKPQRLPAETGTQSTTTVCCSSQGSVCRSYPHRVTVGFDWHTVKKCMARASANTQIFKK